MLAYLVNTLIFTLVGLVIALRAFSGVEVTDWIFLVALYFGISAIRCFFNQLFVHHYEDHGDGGGIVNMARVSNHTIYLPPSLPLFSFHSFQPFHVFPECTSIILLYITYIFVNTRNLDWWFYKTWVLTLRLSLLFPHLLFFLSLSAFPSLFRGGSRVIEKGGLKRIY